jgi:hypothetical protein
MRIEIRKLNIWCGGGWGYKTVAYEGEGKERKYVASRRFETKQEAEAYKGYLEKRYANFIERGDVDEGIS